MTDAKKPKAKPLSLYPMSFEEAVRRAIEAGPYLAGKEFDEYKGIKKPEMVPRKASGRRTTPAGRPKPAKPAARNARGH